MLTLILGLNSCSKDNDARELLSTVPGSAQAVVVINLQKIIKDIDASTDGDMLKLNDQLRSLSKNFGDENPLDLFQKGGVKLTSVVFFMEGGNEYCTGFVGDEDVFISYFEKVSGEKFTTKNGMKTCGPVAVADGRFWASGNRDFSKVQDFMQLGESSSMVSKKRSDVADRLSSESEDISGLVSMAALSDMYNGISMYQQMIGNVDYVFFNVLFDKGFLGINAYFLDGKYKPAKDPGNGFEKINMSTVQLLEGNMQYVMAVGIQKGIMRQITSQFNANVPGIDGVQGTVAIGADPSQMQGSGLPAAMAAIKTDSPENATKLGEYVKEMLSTAVKVSVKGQTLILRSANTSGKLNVGKHLSDLDGSYFGIIMSPDALTTLMPGNNIPFDGASMTIIPDNESLKMQIKVYSGSKNNSLITLLKIAAAAAK